MMTYREIEELLKDWITAWNSHDLEGVLAPMSDEIVFGHWNGKDYVGVPEIRGAWGRWFAKRDFKFSVMAILIDVDRQSFTFEWTLNWPSPERGFIGRPEERIGIDVIELVRGKIIAKRTYTKTTTRINAVKISLESIDPGSGPSN